MACVFYYDFPAGKIGIIEDGGNITGVFFRNREHFLPKGIADSTEKETPLIKTAAAQLGEYFKGKRKQFDLPLLLRGTDFQKAVWNALLDIPFGETRNYRQVAEAAGNPKACRAAGMANNRNPVVIIVPCHRVIGADGSLTGYGGGIELKSYLLNLEQAGTHSSAPAL